MIFFSEYRKLNENSEPKYSAYHGSPFVFTKFKTNDVFLAKNKEEASRYGKNLYKVTFDRKPRYETNTIYVIKKEDVITLEKL